MTQRRVVICCTFRSFSNAENDEIQYAFLESLSSVSLKERFELVVTQFGETGVEEALKKFPIKSTVINEVSRRFSLTRVLLNGIEHAKGDSVVWTTVDIKGNQDSWTLFFQKLKLGYLVTCHPHIIDDFQSSSLAETWRHYMGFGFDIIGLSPKCVQRIRPFVEEYINIGWGGFEHQIIAFANETSMEGEKLINIAPEVMFFKSTNPRSSLGEVKENLQAEWWRNYERWLPWINQSISRKGYLNLAYCSWLFETEKSLQSISQQVWMREIGDKDPDLLKALVMKHKLEPLN